MLLAFFYLGWDRWWWGANLKAIRPPFELYYHHWLIISLGCCSMTEAASAILYNACLIWSLCALVRIFRTFYGVLLCCSGQSALRLRDSNVNKTGEEFGINRGRRKNNQREQSNLIYEDIYRSSVLIHSFILYAWVNLASPCYGWSMWISHFYNTWTSSYWYNFH